MFRVADAVFDIGAVAVPVLDGGGPLGCGHVEVGDDEAVAVDVLGHTLEGEGELPGGDGASSAGSR